MQEFVADVRRRPGAINYGSSGTYGTMHVPMEILSQTAGLKIDDFIRPLVVALGMAGACTPVLAQGYPAEQWWKGDPINPFPYLGGRKP